MVRHKSLRTIVRCTAINSWRIGRTIATTAACSAMLNSRRAILYTANSGRVTLALATANDFLHFGPGQATMKMFQTDFFHL